MRNCVACSCDGWRGMSYDELLILHMQVPEAVLLFDYHVVWLALSKALQSFTSQWLVLISSHATICACKFQIKAVCAVAGHETCES